MMTPYRYAPPMPRKSWQPPPPPPRRRRKWPSWLRLHWVLGALFVATMVCFALFMVVMVVANPLIAVFIAWVLVRARR